MKYNRTKKTKSLFNRYTPFLVIALLTLLYAHYHFQYQPLIEKHYPQIIQQQMMDSAKSKDLYLAEKAYIENFELDNVLPENLTLLSEGHAKDQNNNVYFTNIILEEADPDTFAQFLAPGLPHDSSLGIDKNHLYFRENIVEHADPHSFVYLGAKKIAFFEVNTQMRSTGQEYQEGLYALDKNHVYFDFEPIIDADPASFELLDTYYDRDKNFIFYKGKKLEGSDADSFIFYPLSHQTYTRYEDYLSGYAIDNNQAYYNFEPIDNVDIKSFKIVKGYYALDKNHVYFQGSIVPFIDAASFHYVNQPVFDHDPTFPKGAKIQSYMMNNMNNRTHTYPEEYKHGYFRDQNACYNYHNTQQVINKTWNCEEIIQEETMPTSEIASELEAAIEPEVTKESIILNESMDTNPVDQMEQ